MTVIYCLRGREYEWDEQKAVTNRLKHGIGFEEAAEVFFDPFGYYADASVRYADEQ